MPITNEQELQEAVNQASALIQAIHDCRSANGRTIADVPEARVRFPRGLPYQDEIIK